MKLPQIHDSRTIIALFYKKIMATEMLTESNMLVYLTSEIGDNYFVISFYADNGASITF